MLACMKRVDYYCPNNHRLIFEHETNRKGIPKSPSPTVCGCGQVYWLAFMGQGSGPDPELLTSLNGIPKALILDRASVTEPLCYQDG